MIETEQLQFRVRVQTALEQAETEEEKEEIERQLKRLRDQQQDLLRETRELVEIDLGDRTGRWRVAGGPEGADVRKVRSRPDLGMDRATLGAIYLGGVRPSTPPRGHRLVVTDPDVLRRADAFFLADRLPHCVTGF